MLNLRWLKYMKDALAFEAKVNGAVSNAKPQIVALTPVSVANATDLATAVALANANKAAINSAIAALKA